MTSKKINKKNLNLKDSKLIIKKKIAKLEFNRNDIRNALTGSWLIEDLVNTILSKMDNHPHLSINYQEKDFPEISHQYLSSDKIKQYTGWTPKTKLNDGIEYCIETYKNIL